MSLRRSAFAPARRSSDAALDTSDTREYSGCMKKTNRRNQKPKGAIFPAAARGRWLPSDNTRPAVFADRKAVANRKACRGKVSSWD